MQDDSAQSILDNVIYGTIATTSQDGSPWAAPQFIVYDKDEEAILWCASCKSQHGQNILNNHKAYIVVYDSKVGPGEGAGVYMQTDVDVVVEPQEVARSMAKLIQRHQGVPYWKLDDVQAQGSPLAIFKATVTQAWINEGGEEDGQFVLYRKAIEL